MPGYTAAMARMLFLRDIDVDVHLRCRSCGHGGAMPRGLLVRRFGPNYPVLSIAPHYRCSRCDSRDTESRPVPRESVPDGVAEAPREPSFDAPLAALQGLLASVRGPERQSESPAARTGWPSSADPHDEQDGGQDDDPDGDAGFGVTAFAATEPRPSFKPFVVPKTPPPGSVPWDDGLEDTGWDEPEAPPKPAFPPRKATSRPLEDLAADGPADPDASPLWEPVSLADMAARLDGPTRPFDGAADETVPEDSPFDETLAAMRRLLAEAALDEEEAPGLRGPANDVHPFRPRDDRAFEDEDDDDDEAEPLVFSHKALVRDDFDEDADEDDLEGEGFEGETPGEDDDRPAVDEDPDEEPDNADILAFAIRDPDKAPSPPRAERKAAPPSGDEEPGFDRTLAALRSMIEDAATEPKVVPVRRKPKPVEASPDEAAAMADDPPPPPPRREEPPAKAPAKPGRPAGTAKRSAQEREIEEAMKALRDLVEEEIESPSPAKAWPEPPPPEDKPDFARAVAAEEPAVAEDDTLPSGKAPRAGAGTDKSPLSKTIAALRGMLELDGRRKR